MAYTKADQLGTKKKKSKRQVDAKKYKTLCNKLDSLYSQFIRLRDGKCCYCGKTENQQCSHVFGRRWQFGRWMPENAVDLDSGCHLYKWHSGEYQVEMVDWFQKTYPDRWAKISYEHSQFHEKFTYEELLVIKENLEKTIKTIKTQAWEETLIA